MDPIRITYMAQIPVPHPTSSTSYIQSKHEQELARNASGKEQLGIYMRILPDRREVELAVKYQLVHCVASIPS
jgi:hypothetical protein